MKGRRLDPLTEHQIAWIRANIATKDQDEIAAHVGMCSRSLRRMLARHNIERPYARRAWTDADTEKLRGLAPIHYVRRICIEMDRDPAVIRKHARHLNITLLSWENYCSALRGQYSAMVEERMTVKQMAARMGKKYNAVLSMLKKMGLRAVPDRRGCAVGHAWNRKASPTPREKVEKPARAPKRRGLPKTEKPSPRQAPPRERSGIPIAIRRAPIGGTVKYCDRCFCPVIDKPENWAKHNQTIHAAPIFPVPCVSRRIA